MSKFKRILSSVLAVIMVLSTFSCLGSVFTFGASAEEATSHIKSKSVLETQFSSDPSVSPYIYMGIDYYESDGKLTDYYVEKGETLTAFLYLKSNMYFGTQTIYLEYDNTFFDITNGEGYSASNPVSTNEYDPGSEGSYVNFAINANHSQATAVGLGGTWLAKPVSDLGTFANAYTELAETISGMDILSASLQRDKTSSATYKLDEDSYLLTYRVTVKNTVNDGQTASGGALINLYTAYLNTTVQNQRKGKFTVVDPTGATTSKKDSVAYGVYNAAGNFLVDDAYATFTCGKNPNAGGGTKYTATFKVDGAVYGTPASYAAGATIATPAENPSKAGYNFVGWALEGTTDIVTSFVMGSAAVTYVAVFEEQVTYTATFMVDGAIYDAVNSYAPGAAIVAPADPTKTGYTFTGWSPAVGTMGNSNAVFNAQFTANTYNVTFMNGSVQFAKNTVKFDGAYNTAVGTPKKTGNTFVGWVDASGNAIPSTHTVANDITYYASFEPATFNAVFNAGSGKFDDGTSTKTVPTVFGQAIVAPADPAQTGFEFGGWTPAVGTMDTDGKTFNAIWNAKQIGVTFMDGSTTLDTKTGDFGSLITAIEDPAKTGYNFAGWEYADHTPASFPITLGETAITVYAKWTAKSYYIEFMNGEDFVDGSNQTFGTPIVVPEDDPAKTGYDFVGWVDEDGNEMPETVPAAATTYYAKFEAKKFVATFKINGETYDSYEVAFNDVIPAPETPENITGYDFVSWVREGTETPLTATSKMPLNGITYVAKLNAKTYNVIFYVDGVEVYRTTAKYGEAVPGYNYVPAAGASFSGWGSVPATMPAEDLSLYGTTGTSTYKVTFNINGEYYSEASVAFGAQVNAPTYTIPEGHSFSGWELPSSMPSQDIILNATLTKNKYAVNYYFFEGDTEAYMTYNVEYGAVIPVPEDPEIEGYEFNGWDFDIPDSMPAEALDIYADVARIECYVEFYDANGEVVDGYDWPLYYGEKVEASQVPTVTKEGFEFKYWTVNGERIAFPYTVTEDTEFVPCFDIQGYDINYYVDGVLKYTDTYQFGQEIVIRDALEKEGYTFSGWTDAPTFTTMPAEDIDIHGTFTAIKYDAKFYLSQEDLAIGNTYDVVPTDFDTVPVAPTDPEKDGYTFIGWTPVLSKMVVGGANYVARFSAGASTYTINIYTMDTEGEYGDPETEERTEATDATVSYTPTIKTGFTVAPESNLSGTVTSDNGLALNIYYARNKYKLITVVDAVETPVEYYYEQEITGLEEPVKEGYTFRGWNADVPAKMPAKDVKLTARFVINQYTITFDTAGGSTIKAIKADYNSNINSPANPTKTGYTFDGWDKIIPGTMPAENMTITAKWKVNQYTIEFAETGDSTIDPITADFGAAIVAPAAPTKVGHTFDGWDVQVPPTMPAGNMTITAKWIVNNYDATFIIGNETKVVPTPYGEIPVAPEAVKVGHTFDEWDKELVAMGIDGATYTAVFHANSYNAVFDAAGGKFADEEVSKSVPVVFGEKVTAPDAPAREGYTFAGWSPAVDTMDAEGITYTAQWDQDLNYCRVKEVNRVTENVYKTQIADYTVKVEGSPIKIMFAYVEGGTSNVTWTYDRNDYFDASDDYATGLVSIARYDANDVLIEGEGEVAYEIWTIRAVFTDGKYRVRAKVSHSEDTWESFDVAKEFVNTYDVAPVDETIIMSTVVDNTTVKRGEYATFTIVAKDTVSRIRFVKDVDGALTTVAYSSTATDDELITISESKDGYRTWVVKLRLSYNTAEEFENQTWKIQYREAGQSTWVDSDKGDFTFKVTKYKETPAIVIDEEPVEPFTIMEVTPPAQTAVKGKYSDISVVVTSDVTRVRILVGTKSSTYLATSNNCKVVDNGDGTSTWTISYRFATAGELSCGVQVRGNAWSEASNFTVTVE